MFKSIKFLKLFCLLLVFINLFSLLSLFFNKDIEDDSTNNDNISVINWSDITISCLGDSITQGAKIETSYPELLGNTLGVKNCYNFGIGWSTCSVVSNCSCHPDVTDAHNAMSIRYNEIPVESDIIIVMCGMNDKNKVDLGTIDDFDYSTYYGSLNILCSGLKSKYKNSYIFFMTTFDFSSPSTQQFIQTPILEICAKYGFDVFDTYSELPFNKENDTVDNVHPNQEFVTNVWTPAIAQFIKDNYKQN